MPDDTTAHPDEAPPTGRPAAGHAIDWSSPRANHPEYPDGSVVEVRVHGIGGESPAVMARDPDPVLVTGDEVVGIFRARDPVVSALEAGDEPRLHVREVVSWGGQTSGTWRHALWVLLLPFALFNVAGRMHVPGRRGDVHRAICRVMSLTMTLAVVALTCTLLMDLIAVQCGAQPACLGTMTSSPAWLAPMRAFSEDLVGRLALAATVPSLVLVLLWVASRYRLRDLGQDVSDEDEDSAGGAAEPTSLADPGFWRNAWATSRLRGIHVTAGSAWISGTLALAWLQVTDGSATPLVTMIVLEAAVVVATMWLVALPRTVVEAPTPSLSWTLLTLRFVALAPLGWMLGFGLTRNSWAIEGWLAVAALAAGAAAMLWWLVTSMPDTEASTSGPDVRISPNVALVGGALLVGAAWFGELAAVPAQFGAQDAGWSGFLLTAADVLLGDVFIAPYVPLMVLGVVQFLLLVLLLGMSVQGGDAVDVRPTASQLDTGAPMWRNLTAVVVALLSLFLTASIGAGVHGLVADWLGARAIAVRPAGDAVLVVVAWLSWTAKVLVFLLAIGAAVAAFIWKWRRFPPDDEVVAEHLRSAWAANEDMAVPSEELEPDRLAEVGELWTMQRLLRVAGNGLLVTVVAACLLLASVVLEAVDAPGSWHAFAWLDGVSMWVVVGVPLAAFLLVRRSLSERATRRQVARLWDVLTFWPRVTHPLAPPCYAETLVPLISQRVTGLASGGIPVTRHDRAGGPVVLAGHSQGSIVAMAAAAHLRSRWRDRVGLVSYGSPIAILYERFFRTAFRDDLGGGDGTVFDHVGRRVRHWHHFFGMTEPFAFPFWEVAGFSEADAVADRTAIVKGWPVTLRVPLSSGPCPACDEQAASTTVERLVVDPPQWVLSDGYPVPPAGHSVYRANVDLDDHLGRIAAELFAAEGTRSGAEAAGARGAP